VPEGGTEVKDLTAKLRRVKDLSGKLERDALRSEDGDEEDETAEVVESHEAATVAEYEVTPETVAAFAEQVGLPEDRARRILEGAKRLERYARMTVEELAQVVRTDAEAVLQLLRAAVGSEVGVDASGTEVSSGR